MARPKPTRQEVIARGDRHVARVESALDGATGDPVSTVPPTALGKVGQTEWKLVAEVQRDLAKDEHHWITDLQRGLLLRYCVEFERYVAAVEAFKAGEGNEMAMRKAGREMADAAKTVGLDARSQSRMAVTVSAGGPSHRLLS